MQLGRRIAPAVPRWWRTLPTGSQALARRLDRRSASPWSMFHNRVGFAVLRSVGRIGANARTNATARSVSNASSTAPRSSSTSWTSPPNASSCSRAPSSAFRVAGSIGSPPRSAPVVRDAEPAEPGHQRARGARPSSDSGWSTFDSGWFAVLRSVAKDWRQRPHERDRSHVSSASSTAPRASSTSWTSPTNASSCSRAPSSASQLAGPDRQSTRSGAPARRSPGDRLDPARAARSGVGGR